MTTIDLDDYVAWLHARGVADAHLPLYREGSELVLRHMAAGAAAVEDHHIDAAVDAVAAAGASARRQANLRAIGAQLQAYVDERDAGSRPAAPPFELDDEPLLELADVPRGASRRARLARISQQHAVVQDEGAPARGTMIDDLGRSDDGAPVPAAATVTRRSGQLAAVTPTMTRPAPAPFTDGPRPGVLASPSRSARVTLQERPLPGCACRTRQDIYPDDYWSLWGKVYLFVTGTAGFFIAMFWNRTASLAMALAFGALGAIVTGATAGWRCTDCRRWIARRGLDDDQLRNQLRRNAFFLGLGAVLAVGCVLAVRSLRADLAEDRRARQALERLKPEIDETGE